MSRWCSVRTATDDADAAFRAGETDRYEDLNEQVRALVDRFPQLAEQAEGRGIIGGGPDRVAG